MRNSSNVFSGHETCHVSILADHPRGGRITRAVSGLHPTILATDPLALTIELHGPERVYRNWYIPDSRIRRFTNHNPGGFVNTGVR